MEINHHVLQALKARNMMKRDVDYIVKDGEIVIVDEFTGRLMFGRRYSDGLHQAIEAKESVLVQFGIEDTGNDNAAELLQNVSEAGGYDRYGEDRGRANSEISTTWT